MNIYIFFSLLFYSEVNSIQLRFHSFSSIPFYIMQIIACINLLQTTHAMKVYHDGAMTLSIMEAMHSSILQMHVQVLPNFRLLTLIID